jgi:hypothetical protein
MRKVVCVLRSGGDYDWEYVERLHHGVTEHTSQPLEFICLTDLEDTPESLSPDIRIYSLLHGWPGWWSLMEWYNIPGPAIAVGLDTVFVGDVSPLFDHLSEHPKAVIGMSDVYEPGKLQTSLMAWGGDVRWIYEKFLKDGPEKIRAEHRGDQEWLRSIGLAVTFIQGILPGFVVSYKADLGRGKVPPPDSAAVVVFHGRPRPHEVKNPPEWMVDWQ